MIGKDGKLYTFEILLSGKKKRISNNHSNICKNNVKCQHSICKALRKDKKIYLPCTKKYTRFENKQEVKEYCDLKVKGPYKKRNVEK